MSIIDDQGYRLNVGIILRSLNGELLLARRNEKFSWQFPQGGITQNENEEQSMYRELYEELGLSKDKVRILAKSNYWYSYRLPKRYIRPTPHQECIGQKQKWFMLDFIGQDADIQLDKTSNPEFTQWRWFHPHNPLHTMAIYFKQDVYQAVLHEFNPYMLGNLTHTSQL